ncbi:hypothetical protein Ptr902_10651 [Pyrenophora tritici-repentis]|uniref:Uncharacterized protein n=1 Tax=Pyrenophora tritici-repentis (strain Pt-1C-BFP) TaxID=426418 RepID=B2WDK0_PYRTR|nr:uncharacterized protein PTRG_08059 [Pyrenophora tritici-repentis Pt-1C-BFP]KAI1528343.1 hypothetical protein PtrSN001A_009004 [Pyrenophora tritici-repentis]EDU50978.1 predicted protein [Pyrenophora tritici-repentis Pt-1C-BFP]KAI1564367.1 hypothetical protein PtrEW7m1_010245 [Pyrenophora tritici-repentis]KAI1595507.1 hypothetical protein PtrCC142_010295 [Pyrenophora tritici-repentis]KAI2477968.1 hypothetical protein Ptr902_10651 [Pyrenophora tritici-repentis]
MAYHHSQGAHGASWSQDNDGNQRVTSSSLPPVSSSGAEQAFGATSPLSGFQSYGQGWNHEAATYSQQPISYYPHPGYQQSGTAGHSFRGHSSFTPNSDAVAGSQENLAGNYTPSPTYPNTNYYGPPQTGSYPSAPGYTPLQPPRLNTSIAPAMTPFSNFPIHFPNSERFRFASKYHPYIIGRFAWRISDRQRL